MCLKSGMDAILICLQRFFKKGTFGINEKKQIIVVGACAILCIGIYLFASTKKAKPAGETPVITDQEEGHQLKAETLDIEAYIAEVNSKLRTKP